MNLLYQLFHRVDTEGEALELIKSITSWFFILAGITAFFSLLNPLGLIDAALYFGVALWFRRTHSRMAAVILAILAGLLLLNTVSAEIVSLRGVIIRVAMAVLSLRGIEAAFKLYRLAGATAATSVAAAGRRSSALDVSTDLGILQHLKKAGADLSKPHLPEFLFDFPSEAAAADAVAKVKALGFDAEITPPAPGRQWPVRAQKSMVLTEETLKRTRYHFDRIARAGQGTYEGWGAPPVT